MKKSFIGPLVTIIILVLLGAMFVYYYISINRLDKKIMTLQQGIADNSNKTAAIVNFFNSNLNAQTNK